MAAESLVGQPLALTIVSIVLLVTSREVVVARSLIRIRLNTFRIDDQLMAIGVVGIFSHVTESSDWCSFCSPQRLVAP